MERIDVLVTGLPVSQYLDDARRNALAEQMRGTHQVTPKRTVSVEKVKVIPQPIGGLLDYIAQEDADIDDALVLVIDPGFFSVDWVVVANKDLHRQSSGTSLNASSTASAGTSRPTSSRPPELSATWLSSPFRNRCGLKARDRIW